MIKAEPHVVQLTLNCLRFERDFPFPIRYRWARWERKTWFFLLDKDLKEYIFWKLTCPQDIQDVLFIMDLIITGTQDFDSKFSLDWSQINYLWIIVMFLLFTDGTHSLQRIHWWTSDEMMYHFSKSVPMKKQIHLAWEWVNIQQIVIFGCTIPFML